MEQTLADAREGSEPEALAERDRGRLRVGHDPNAAHLLALGERKPQDVANQRASEPKALGSPIDAESRQSQDR